MTNVGAENLVYSKAVPERQTRKPVLLNWPHHEDCLHQPTLPISIQIDFPTHLFLLAFNSEDIC